MHQRKLLLPPFHGDRMQAYRELMAAVAEREVERWPVGKPLRLWDRMQAITLEIILRAVLGIEDPRRLELFRERITTMIAWLMRWRQMLTLAVLGPRIVESRELFEGVVGPVDELLLDEIRRRRTDASGREDILSLLVQARDPEGRPMNDDELRDELMTLLMAGHETTATTLAWALERLVRHPQMLARIAEEAADGDERYVDAVAKEAMRLRPVAPVVVRRLLEPMEIGGYRLPAGVLVAPCVYLVHRHPDVYPDPERFRPERFLQRPPGTYTWIPFGGGVRRCLGASFALAEMRSVLSVVAARVVLRPHRSASERIRRRAVTLAPSRGAEAIVVDRGGPTMATAAGYGALPSPPL
jgi:cytochrome P450